VCAAASVVDRSECREALEQAFVVWLDAPPDVLAGRFASAPHRPRYDENIGALLAEQDVRRRPGMAAVADLVVDVSSCAPEDVVRTIVERVS
jgi:shikimate kinase